MSSPNRRLLILLAVAIALALRVVAAQSPVATTTAQNAALDQTIPVDPLITVGTLPNGLRYYVRANRQPQGRAELRLVVKAGSILEDEDQRGLAHFVEHMSFNGTRHFPKQDVAAFMQAHRHAVRRARERAHGLRRDGLRTADPHHQPRRHRPVAAHPGRLGARGLLRSR